MKPNAPVEYRGQFSPIRTSVPGIEICEHMPRLAKRADKYAIIRGITHSLADHGLGTRYLMTGNLPTPVVNYPMYGSVVSREIPAARGLAFVCIDRSTRRRPRLSGSRVWSAVDRREATLWPAVSSSRHHARWQLDGGQLPFATTLAE